MTWQITPEGQEREIYNPLAGNGRGNGKGQTAGANIPRTFYETALEKLRDAATGPGGQFTPAELEAQAPETVAWCRRKAQDLVQQINDESLTAEAHLAFEQPEQVVEALLNDLLGMGPLEELLRLPDVEDVAINGPHDVWYKAQGGWVKSPIQFRSSEVALLTLNRAIVRTGRQAGPLTPIVDATLRQGHRINIITEPLTDPWPVAAIRVHRDHSLRMEELVSSGGEDYGDAEPVLIPDYFSRDDSAGMISALAASFLHMAVVAGFNVLVVGAAGVGKTTLLGALGRMIPNHKRIVVIEDTRELRFRGAANGENCVYLLTRPATLEGLPAITQRDLVITALRQRPDALTVGEARGAEVFDMLKALWTGHRNGLTSIHADSITDVSSRIRMMLQEASFQTAIAEETVSLWIAKAFHLGITLRRTETGRRYVEEIVEFTGGVEANVPVTTTLFTYDPTLRRLRCTGHRLDAIHEAMLREAGYTYDAILDAARERRELL
jgi:pilus assembly protein CpaF